jgi:SNF2 family DNA or RNA helicase
MGKCVVLADEMGLGKTFTSLLAIHKACYADYTPHSNPDHVTETTLIVCPLSLIHHWFNDATMHLGGGNMSDMIQIYHGKDRSISPKTRIVVTTYDILSRDFHDNSIHTSPLHKQFWTNVILDEAHIIRNLVTCKKKRQPNSKHKIGSACLALRKKYGYALTGTPFCNDITDIHSLLLFIGEDTNLAMSPDSGWLIRRCKADNLGLPPCTEEVVFTESTPEMDHLKKYYMERGSTAACELKSGNKQERSQASMQILTCALRLRQLCCSPFLLPDVNLGDAGSKTIVSRSPKIAKIRELVVDYIDSGHKIVIFSKFVGYLKLIHKALEPITIPLLFIGSMNHLEREDTINRFNHHPHSRVMLISIDCGGTGLNLTQATRAILTEPWYNPFTELQAQNRIDRIGQTCPTRVIRLVDNSIKSADIWVRGIQQKKTTEAKGVISGLSGMYCSYQQGGDVSMKDFIDLFRNVDQLKLSPYKLITYSSGDESKLLSTKEEKVVDKIERSIKKEWYTVIEQDGKKYKVKVTRKIVDKVYPFCNPTKTKAVEGK